nr:reverse transcriptase domain-containing protein [Tanacetum cinerariifolium]
MDDEPMWAADRVVAPNPGSEMLRNFHGHNLSKGNIIKIFYHGLSEITQKFLNATAGGIFLYKTPNQAYLKDKVLLKLDWAKNKNTKSSLKKTVAFADKGNSNFDTDKIMARMDAMTIKMDAQYKELQSRAKQTTPDFNEDDMPISRKEEAKFMQTFSKNYQASIQNLKTKFDRLADKQYGRPSGSLLSNTQPNPRGNKAYKPPQSRNENMNAVFTRSGKSYGLPNNPNNQQNNSKNPINFDSNDEDDGPTPQPRIQPTKPVKETPRKQNPSFHRRNPSRRRIFFEFDEFMAMTADENFESESDTDEPPFEKITINTDYKSRTSLEEPPTDLELRPLPDNLEYVFFKEPSFLPVIISSNLSAQNKNKLVSVLKKHNKSFAWKTTDIPGICPSLCKHKLQLLDDKKPVAQKQRRLNTNIQKVVKKEIMKLLDTAGFESRPPMLNKENYVPWSSRLLRYAKSRPNRKLIRNSILNGPYVRKMIPEPGDANREITVTETFYLQTDDELSENKLKQIEADDQAIQTILLGLPEDIYAAVDSCETAQEIWLRVQQMMKGSDIGIQEKKAKLFNEWERFSFNEGESIEFYYHRFLKLMNDLKRNKHFLEKIASNLKFLNNLQPEWSQHVTIVHQTKDLHTADYT